MEVKAFKFARLSDGSKVTLYIVKNDSMSFSVMDYGCTITSIKTPDKNGNVQDIVLGYSTFDGYLHDDKFLGVFVGRFANRIGNAAFSLNGTNFKLDKNDGENCLHGGHQGYNKKLWHSEITKTRRGSGVRFTRTSPDGEQGFPGNVKIEVTYLLNDKNEILMRYQAKTDTDTPINLTNHTYFNLKGEGNGTILDHSLMLNCDSFLEIDDAGIPTGKFVPVFETPYDFNKAKIIGADINKTKFGYDHNFCINQDGKQLTTFASVMEQTSGRKMTVSTNQPGVQFYSGNFLKDTVGKNGLLYPKQGGFCLETQKYPDSPNHSEFPSCILKAGETEEFLTVYSFEW
ncbi:MAG: galactose mutarotase [Treponema sp. CETP13]|nr:MAG: galactose mutarotase [Treponema sp. CETP13]